MFAVKLPGSANESTPYLHMHLIVFVCIVNDIMLTTALLEDVIDQHIRNCLTVNMFVEFSEHARSYVLYPCKSTFF